MTDEEATLAVLDALAVLDIPYLLTGSFASTYYGIPRLSKDADLVVRLEDRSVRDIANHLGPAFQLDPQGAFETITMTTRHTLEVVGIPFQIELFHLTDDPHDQERFRRRVRVKAFGRDVCLPTVEDVIVTKLRWAQLGRRGKDWDDTRNVIAVQGDRIDWEYVHRWCDRHGTRAVLDEVRASIPPI